MVREVVVLGIGGYAVTLVEMMASLNAQAGMELWRPIGYLDDNPAVQGTDYCGLPVLGTIATAKNHPEAYFINAIGSTRTAKHKAALIRRAEVPQERFATLVHPSSVVSASATIGFGTAVTQSCVIMANTRLGDHVKLLPLSTVSYGSTIGDYTTIGGGAVVAAEVRVGSNVYVGANATVRERIAIGDGAIVGMGAVVVRNVDAGTVVIGNPAKPTKL